MGTIDAFQRLVWSPQFKQNCFPHRSKMGVLKSFHNLVIQIKGKIWESLLFAWLGRILGQEGAIRKKPPFSDDLRIQRIGLRDRASGRNAVITPMMLRKRNKRAESTLGPAFGGGRRPCATL